MKEKQRRDEYLGVIDEARDETMALLVEDGLRAAKKAKLMESKSEEAARSIDLQPVFPHPSSAEPLASDGTALAADVVSSESLSVDWLEVLSGDVLTHADGLIECAEGFGTIKGRNCSINLTPQSSSSPSHHQFYYEVELVTAGLFQVTSPSTPSSHQIYCTADRMV
jgi:hypothetical protein